MVESERRSRVRTCSSCGCTDDRACPGGCWWIGPKLCSGCGDAPDLALVPAADRPRGLVARSTTPRRRRAVPA